MRVPNNKLSAVRSFFYSTLRSVYPEGETEALFLTAAGHYLGQSRTQLLRDPDQNLNQSDLLLLYDCAKALGRHEPLQYILGTAWFSGMKLSVNPGVLIPRPETEELVSVVLKTAAADALSALDAATGSGCIALALKKHRRNLKVSGCDVSDEALRVARTNTLIQDLDVSFFNCDLLTGKLPAEYDVIVSNPPYITRAEAADMHPNVLAFEPAIALFAPDDDPLIFYKKIADLCSDHLRKNGMLFLELNPLTAHGVLDYAGRSGIFKEAAILRDISGKDRFFQAKRA